jgi:hypothetical protein
MNPFTRPSLPLIRSPERFDWRHRVVLGLGPNKAPSGPSRLLLRLRESSRYRNEADTAEIYEYAPIFTEQQVVILGYGDAASVGEIARRSYAFEPLQNGS